MKPKENKPTICVFVSTQFLQLFPNFDSIYRPEVTDETVIFDCTKVTDKGNYLDIDAINKEMPDHPSCNANIWIPTTYVRAVLLRSEDRVQMGFRQPPQVDKVQNQADQSP
jgi:hypothetical protein